TIGLILNQDSSLHQFLKIIQFNIQLDPKFNPSKNPKLIAIANFLNQTGVNANIIKNLQDLQTYLTTIIAAGNTNKASYYAATDRLHDQADNNPITTLNKIVKQAPMPVKNWLINIDQASWEILLANSQKYLNMIWQASVLPYYQREIKQHYPLSVDSKVDISLNDFSEFFGPSGIIEDFFNNYLAPFVNTHQTYWTWKQLDGIHISIPQSTLEAFLRASIIQQMFFSDNQRRPGFQFNLTPVSLSTTTSSLNLNLGGQVVEFRNDLKEASDLNWPGPNQNLLTVKFISNTHRQMILSFSGPWAWFKLLAESKLETTPNFKRYKLTIQLGNQAAHYIMTTDNLINPYLPNVLTHFALPQKL
ncbi:MAG: hypothetical protein K0U12_05975, partial [Gammaproteobacteria bacterium]|nr:hypothetical protein [Gammaproteobacteria bacterium]